MKPFFAQEIFLFRRPGAVFMRLVKIGDRIINLAYVALAEWDAKRVTLAIHFALARQSADGEPLPGPNSGQYVRLFSGSEAEAIWAKLSKDSV